MNHPLLNELLAIYSSKDPLYLKARAWRFEAVNVHAPVDLAGNIIITLMLAYLFAAGSNPVAVGCWLAISNACALTRVIVGARFQALDKNKRTLAKHLFRWSLVIHGMTWAAAFFIFAGDSSVIDRSIVIIWLGGTAAWVVSAYTLIIEAVVLFLLVQILPISIFLLLGQQPGWQMAGLACLAFLPSMIMVALRNNLMLIQGHITQLEKEKLADDLAQERAAVIDLNRDLESDLERRQLIEIDLREQKARAEALADELEKLSSLDGLTGIANRRRFDQTLEREWKRAARNNQPLALIMCDIDYFKEYNDLYGHQSGDACLRQLAKLLETSMRRGGDLAARYGGEEFAILLPDTTSANALKLAENLRQNLLQLGLPHEGSRIAPVLTASFGVAALIPQHDSSPDALVSAADRALYVGKDKGRNRVEAASSAGGENTDDTSAHIH